MIDHQTGFVASTVGDRALLALGAHADLSISRVSISRVSISRANIQVVTQSSVLADPLRMADPRRRLLAGLTRPPRRPRLSADRGYSFPPARRSAYSVGKDGGEPGRLPEGGHDAAGGPRAT